MPVGTRATTGPAPVRSSPKRPEMRGIRRVRRKADAPPESASAESPARVSFRLHRRSLRRILPTDRPSPGRRAMDAAATALPFQPIQTIAPLNVGDMDARVSFRAVSRSPRRPLYSRARCPCAPRARSNSSRPSGRLRPASGSRRRSMKCSCAAERSFSSDARHLAMNAPGVMPLTQRRRSRTAERRFSSLRSRHRPSVSWRDTAPRAGRHSVS